MSNEKLVSVEVKLRPKDVYRPYFWSWQNLLRLFIALMLAFATYDACLAPNAPVKSLPDGSSISAVLVAVVCFIILGLILFPYLRVRAAMKKAPVFQRSSRYSFSPDGMQVENEDATGNFKWSAFSRILEVRTTFLFFRTDYSATYFPKRCFRSPDEIVLLRELIRENFKGKWRLRRE